MEESAVDNSSLPIPINMLTKVRYQSFLPQYQRDLYSAFNELVYLEQAHYFTPLIDPAA